jgi:hypothetical protein
VHQDVAPVSGFLWIDLDCVDAAFDRVVQPSQGVLRNAAQFGTSVGHDDRRLALGEARLDRNLCPNPVSQD